MQTLFSGATSFNRDISLWDVSNVNNAWQIFRSAQSFNVDLSCWEISKVSNWGGMFFGARSFDQELCGTHWVNPNRWPKPDNMFVGSNGSIGIEACVAACSGLAPKADDGSGPNPSPKAASSGSSSPSPGVGSNSRGVPSPSSRPESILSIPSQPTESIDSPLLYNIGVGAVLAPSVRKSVRYFTTLGKKSDLKYLEKMEKLEPILKDIDKDIKNNMSLKDLKKKYIEADASSVVKKTGLNQALKSTGVLLPYIHYKLSNTNKAKASKLENKSGNLFYKVNITKDGILKFNTAGPLIAPSYKVSNLFTRGKFTTWGGKKRRRRTKRRRKRKRKRTKRN